MTLKNAIASCLIIALGIILALHFALFWIYGGVFITETNRTILVIETVMSVAILAFGIERLLNADRDKTPEGYITGDRRSGRKKKPIPARETAPASFSSSSGQSEDISVSISQDGPGLANVRISPASSDPTHMERCVSFVVEDGS